MVEVLETKRLLLRPYTTEDAGFFAELWADKEVVRYIGEGVTRTKREAEQGLQRIIDGYQSGFGLLGVWNKEEKCLIGHAGLVKQEVEQQNEIELGYWLARRFWGQGFATEAALVLRDHAFYTKNLSRIISLIQPANTASIAVATRVGMKHDRDVQFRGLLVSVYSMNHADLLEP